MSEIVHRPAVIGDAADIHSLLLSHAADIPLAVETLEQEEALYSAIRKIIVFGQSWVAEGSGTITGAVLVDSAEVGRHWGENELLNLRYAAGVALDELIGKIVERKVPMIATVKDGNRSDLATRLERAGFQPTETRIGEQHFRREP